MRTVFREVSHRKTVSCEEKIMSNNKYPSMFTRQLKPAVAYISNKCVWNNCEVSAFKIFEDGYFAFINAKPIIIY